MQGVSICVSYETMLPYRRARNGLFFATPDFAARKQISIRWKEPKFGRRVLYTRLNPVRVNPCAAVMAGVRVRVSESKARLISRAGRTGCTPVQGRVHRIGMVACFISEICRTG